MNQTDRTINILRYPQDYDTVEAREAMLEAARVIESIYNTILEIANQKEEYKHVN